MVRVAFCVGSDLLAHHAQTLATTSFMRLTCLSPAHLFPTPYSAQTDVMGRVAEPGLPTALVERVQTSVPSDLCQGFALGAINGCFRGLHVRKIKLMTWT